MNCGIPFFGCTIRMLVEVVDLWEGTGEQLMEEMIRTESWEAGGMFSKQVLEGILMLLLGIALMLSQVFSGVGDGAAEEEQIAYVDFAGGKIAATDPDRKSGFMGDEEYLILKKMLLEERPVRELRLADSVMPEQTLILPDVSDGNVWDALHGDMAAEEAGKTGSEWNGAAREPVIPGDSFESGNAEVPAVSGNLSEIGNPNRGDTVLDSVVPENPSDIVGGIVTDPVVPENPPGIVGGIVTDPSVPGNPSGIVGGIVTDPVVPGNPSGIVGGIVTDPSVPGNPSGIVGGIVTDPSVPGNPSGTVGGIVTDPSVPGNPSGIVGGIATDPAVPENPSGSGTVVDPTVPGDPSGDGTVVDPAVPEDPAGGIVVDPVIPENPSEGGEAADPAVPDTGDEENGEQPSVSCFLLDEMGMLYGFLPEYAEIPDGCLTLPAECTGIRRGAFSGCGAGILELYIPAGAVTIEEGALADLVSLEWIDVESGNSGCVSDSGVLFDSTMSVLLAFPAAWMDIYSVPSYVTRIADRAFDGTSIYRLDLRECSTLSFGQNVFGSSGGSGIEVAVREPELAMYAEILSGYAVTLTK